MECGRVGMAAVRSKRLHMRSIKQRLLEVIEHTPDPLLEETLLFKRRLKGLAKRYRQIQIDIQPELEQISLSNFIGNRISGTSYTVYKVRAKNSDARVGKNTKTAEPSQYLRLSDAVGLLDQIVSSRFPRA